MGGVGAIVLGLIPILFAIGTGVLAVRATRNRGIRVAAIWLAGAVGASAAILLTFSWFGELIAIAVPVVVGGFLALGAISPWPAGFARRRPPPSHEEFAP